MNELLLWLGRVAGLGGLLLCLVALGSRFSGSHWVAGFQVGTLLQGAMAYTVCGHISDLAWLFENTRGG